MEYQVLIVDDDTTTRKRALEALIAYPRAGVAYKIAAAGSAAAAQLQAGRRRFHLIVVALRQMSAGLELISQLRDLDADLRLLVLRPADASALHIELATRLGARVAERPTDGPRLCHLVLESLGIEPLPTPAPAPRPVAVPAQRPLAMLGDIQLLLDVLQRQSQASVVLYTDGLGNLIAQRGEATAKDISSLATLIAGSFVNSRELARQLDDPETLHLSVHEGRSFDIYSVNCGADRLVALLFDKQKSAPKLGFVWLLLKRAADQLTRMGLHAHPSIDPALGEQLSASLNDEFDRLFGSELAGDMPIALEQSK
jgi:CheY-like chemotaxis protein